jgi:excisionase family DNA binding protein
VASGDAAPGLTAAEAADIIGVTRQTVYKLVHSGELPKARKNQRAGLDRVAVEQAGLARVPARGGHPYFLTANEAAEVLGVTPKRVHQLAERGRLPVVEHDGRRLFRRPQLEVVANARRARWVTRR